MEPSRWRKVELHRRILYHWGTEHRMSLPSYAWMATILGLVALAEHNRLGLFLVPPFAATLTIILLLPDASLSQPYPVVIGMTVGAGIGTGFSFVGHGPGWAVVACLVALFAVVTIRAFHPPAVALSLYPLLLHPGIWFALAVVLPFAILATSTASLMSRLLRSWPPYPKPLR